MISGTKTYKYETTSENLLSYQSSYKVLNLSQFQNILPDVQHDEKNKNISVAYLNNIATLYLIK